MSLSEAASSSSFVVSCLILIAYMEARVKQLVHVGKYCKVAALAHGSGLTQRCESVLILVFFNSAGLLVLLSLGSSQRCSLWYIWGQSL